jgi:ketosteroid isomerase-like protein
MQLIARSLLLVALLSLGGCIQQFGKHKTSASAVAGPTTEQQIESALQRYSGRIMAMDASAVADMYAPDGVWERQSGPLRGRDAIRAALAETGGVRVLKRNDDSHVLLQWPGGRSYRRVQTDCAAAQRQRS